MPVGAVEQHGPHLPLGVDAQIAEALVDAALDRVPEDLPVTALPTFWIGRSEEHRDFPGSLTLSAETLRRVWYETGASVARAGLRKLLILNSHGGQTQVMQIVARELRIDHGMLVTSCSWPQLGLPEGLISPHEQKTGIHAGEIETSMMLAIGPELVRRAEMQDFPPVYATMAEEFPILMGLGAAGFGWKAQDLHPSGAAGNASTADADKGRAIIEHVADRLAALFEEIVRFPLPAAGR